MAQPFMKIDEQSWYCHFKTVRLMRSLVMLREQLRYCWVTKISFEKTDYCSLMAFSLLLELQNARPRNHPLRPRYTPIHLYSSSNPIR